MGFTFGFTEDIEEDFVETQENNNDSNLNFINPIDNLSTIFQEPKLHTYKELLHHLVNKRITYELVEGVNDFPLYKRELFDVRHQLMIEDKLESDKNSKEEFNILIGDTDEDLKNGVYEGGLKSWECSFDMIEMIKSLQLIEKLMNNNNSSNANIIELGCGTSLPTLYILQSIFLNNELRNNPINVILSDFNYDVLRLVSLPNILINWCLSVLTTEDLIKLQERDSIDGNIREGEIDVTPKLIDEFCNWMLKNQINISFISGSWCRQFMNIIDSSIPNLANDFNIILTSETIYSPQILPVISEILVELTPRTASPNHGATLLSAKDIYFGVGGSIVECVNYLEARNMNVETKKVQGNLKRSVLSLSHQQ